MRRLLISNPQLGPIAVMAVSLGALGMAYVSEVWGGLEPCILCYYQRYAYAVAFACGLLGLILLRKIPALRACLGLAGLSFLTGGAIAFFHVGVEQLWWRGTAECHAPVFDPDLSIDALREQMLGQAFVACDKIQWSLFGLSMAGYNVIASLALAAATFWLVSALGRRQSL